MKKIIEGLTDKSPQGRPPKSPPGFTWPSPAKPADKRNFRLALNEVLSEKDLSATDVARGLYGVRMIGGSPKPMNVGGPRGWMRGDIFPRAATAEYLAEWLEVPVARLMTPGGLGDFVVPERKMVTKSAHAARGNGHEVEPLPLPEGEKPAVIRFETLEVDSRFARVHIEGVLQVEHALTLVAMLAHRERH